MNKYLSNITISCSRKDIVMVLLGIIPFIPASWYIVKIIRSMSINWVGIKHYNLKKQHQVTKDYYGVEVL